MNDDDFEPRLGKTRSSGADKRFAHQLRATINRAGGRLGRRSKFSGKRSGRGGVASAVLSRRDKFAAYRQRRVVVKARIVKLSGKGMDAAKAHLRYIQRDGVSRKGERGQLYNAEHDRANGKTFIERAEGDRHQFRFIVAPEDGLEYEDFKSLTRRLMTQMEEDLGTRLDWVAVDHFNTGHPHTHIMLRGKDDRGNDLIIARDYISHAIRERTAELVLIDLGPRTDGEIEKGLRAEMTSERLTSLDRQLLRMEKDTGAINLSDKSAFRQTLLTGRLKHLERLGLAAEQPPGQWHLSDGLEETLRRMGERGDIIKTMHRALTEKNLQRSPADYTIHDPANAQAQPVTGRVTKRGLADELYDRHYLIVDALDGRAHYIDIGPGMAVEPTPAGSIVRVTPRSLEPKQADRTVAEVAAANGGRYSIDLHLKHDPTATEAFAETHVRRLEVLRRANPGVVREPDGTWLIPPDHLEQAAGYEREQARWKPVTVDKLSSLTLDKQVATDGATWLDREIVSGKPEQTRDSGFGHDVRDALKRRQQWLVEQGLAEEKQGRFVARPKMLATLQQRELARAALQLSDELGLAYVETNPGSRIEGTLRRTVELASGKAALIERSRDFTLVPWRPVLDRHIGQHVSGLMRSTGSISWTIGRQRGVE